jgi:hypothetical protein
MYECILYESDNGIFNVENKLKKYRQINEKLRIIFNDDDVYENKKPTKRLIYLRTSQSLQPIINICFTSDASVTRYIKNNKLMLLNNYGKLGTDYYYEMLLFSHLDRRAV